MYKFVVYEDEGGKWRWKLVSTANGQTVATPGEGFASEQNCRDNIDRVKVAGTEDSPVENE